MTKPLKKTSINGAKQTSRLTRSMNKNALVTDFLTIKKRVVSKAPGNPKAALIEKNAVHQEKRPDSAVGFVPESVPKGQKEKNTALVDDKENKTIEESKPECTADVTQPDTDKETSQKLIAVSTKTDTVSESTKPVKSVEKQIPNFDLFEIKDERRAPVSKIPRLSPSKCLKLVFSSFLALPATYERLFKIFNALEYAVFYHHGKRQAAIYHRIKSAVESISGHTFTTRDLARIAGVSGELYEFKPVRVVVNAQRMFTYSIAPLYPQSCGPNESTKTIANVIEKRKTNFRQALVDLVGGFYMEFAKTHPSAATVLKTPSKLSPKSALLLRGAETSNVHLVSSWHLDFPLNDDTIVPLPVEAPLPPLGTQAHLNKQISSALAITRSKSVPEPLPVERPDDGAPKTKAATLLERIRQRERAQTAQKEAVNASPGTITFRAMLGRITDVARTASFFFTSAKRHAVFLPELAKHICNSSKSGLSERESLVHIQLLASVYFRFLTLKNLSAAREKDVPLLVIGSAGIPASQIPAKFELDAMDGVPFSRVIVSISDQKPVPCAESLTLCTTVSAFPAATTILKVKERSQFLLSIIAKKR